MPINYQSDTSPLYAGRFAPNALPLWAVNAPLNQHVVVPLSVTIPDLDPRYNALINPVYPSAPEWYGFGHDRVVNAWCGLAFDTDTATLCMPPSGGHSDYAGNEPYKLNLYSESPAWEMVRYPSGAIGNILTTNDGLETTGVYADGRPRSMHTYDKPVFAPGEGVYLTTQGGQAWSASSAVPSKTLKIDMVTGETEFLAEMTNRNGTSGSGSCYDSSRHGFWYKSASNQQMNFYDIALNTWTYYGSFLNYNGNVTCQYIPSHDVVMMVNQNLTNGFSIFDCSTYAVTEPPINGAFIGSTLRGTSKPALVESDGYLAFWDNATDTTLINTLTIPTDPRVDTWNVGQLTVDAGNSVTPAIATVEGTYGRFLYSVAFGGFFIYPQYSADLIFFRIK